MSKKTVFIWLGIGIILLGMGFSYLYLKHGGDVSGGYIITEDALIQKGEKNYILFGNRRIEIPDEVYAEIEVDKHYGLRFTYNDFFSWH